MRKPNAHLDAVIENELRLIAPRGKANHARELLEGWWWPRICHAVFSTPTEAIPVSAIEAKLDDIRDQVKRDALVPDFEHADPSEAEVAEYRLFASCSSSKPSASAGTGFGMPSATIIAHSRGARNGHANNVVVDEELEKFEAPLMEEREPRFGAMCDAHIDTSACWTRDLPVGRDRGTLSVPISHCTVSECGFVPHPGQRAACRMASKLPRPLRR
jgi:hypothetical protein